MANFITISLKRKILFLVITVTLIPVVFIGIISFDSAKNALQQESLSKLEKIADLKVQRIEQFFNSMKLDIEIARENPTVKENLPTLSKFVDDRIHPDYVEARQMTNSQLLHLQNVKDWIVDVILVNPEGRIVYVTNVEHEIEYLGNPLPDPDGKAFEEGKNEVYLTDIFQNPVENLELGMLLIAPEDLMAPTLTTEFPYISPCDVDAIVSLYDNGGQSKVICEI